MKLIRYHLELGDTAAYTKILIGGDKGAGEEGIKRVNEVFFPVLQLVLFNEISGGSRLHWH